MDELRELLEDEPSQKNFDAVGVLDKLFELLADSTLVQAAITFSVIGTICGLVLTGNPIPDIIQQLAFVIVGFYFGAKHASVVRRLDQVRQQILEERNGRKKDL